MAHAGPRTGTPLDPFGAGCFSPLPKHFLGAIMKLPRRQFLHLAAGVAAPPVVSRVVWAQTYPARPVRIIVGLAAGGGTDIVARLIGQWLSERLRPSFVIEHPPDPARHVAAHA